MKNELPRKRERILAIAPSSAGFGFAILEGQETLIHWGVKAVSGDKNMVSLIRVKDLITRYQPGVIVLQDASAEGSRRSTRVKALTKKIFALASRHDIKVKLFTRERTMNAFLGNSNSSRTKHDVAQIIAKQFSQELGSRLPPKRKFYESEDSRMDIFDAMALALMTSGEMQKSRNSLGSMQSLYV